MLPIKLWVFLAELPNLVLPALSIVFERLSLTNKPFHWFVGDPKSYNSVLPGITDPEAFIANKTLEEPEAW